MCRPPPPPPAEVIPDTSRSVHQFKMTPENLKAHLSYASCACVISCRTSSTALFSFITACTALSLPAASSSAAARAYGSQAVVSVQHLTVDFTCQELYLCRWKEVDAIDNWTRMPDQVCGACADAQQGVMIKFARDRTAWQRNLCDARRRFVWPAACPLAA